MTKTMTISTCVERIKPGRWFRSGSNRRFMKLQDVLPSGVHQTYVRVDPKNCYIYSDFAINAVDEDGVTGCCPYGMDIFFVASEDDLYPADFVSPTVRHIPNVERINKLVTT